MTIATILNNRASARAFTNKKIPTTELEAIFALAQQSVSNCNVQPWQTMVVSGETRERLKAALMKTLMAGQAPNPDFDWTPKYQDEHRERQFGSANALYGALGIERGDKKARMESMARNWTFFDAPHVAFFCMQKYLGIMGAVDMGVYAQTVSLILQEAGIASCMQGALGQFPDPVREVLKLPDELGILFGMSFGYADAAAPVNAARTSRAELAEAVKFYN
ncbi:MAG: nitroreductase [Proteobacteria bacterium]|nr:nitroreductase [Pseudomonadota bacterium]